MKSIIFPAAIVLTSTLLTTQSHASSACGGKISSIQANNLLQRYRGHDNGARDDNADGRISFHESFSQWEFMQIQMVLQQGKDRHDYTWVNLDTCYSFKIKAEPVHEDMSKGVLYQSACRHFTIHVTSDRNSYLGSERNTACRNFGTHKWEIY